MRGRFNHIPNCTDPAYRAGVQFCPCGAITRFVKESLPAQIDISNQNAGFNWYASFCMNTQFIASVAGLNTL